MPAYSARDSLKQFTADMERIAGPDAEIRAYKTFEGQVLFYFNRRIPSINVDLPDGDDEPTAHARHAAEVESLKRLDEFLDGPATRRVLSLREVYDALDAPRRARMEIVLESQRTGVGPGLQSVLLRRAPSR
jgi:hypothetical protein